MKLLSNKVIKSISMCMLFFIMGNIINLNEFNFMNYDFICNKYILIVIFLLMIYKLSIDRYNISNISLDDNYWYKLHILLHVIWLFLFFLYGQYLLSLITIIFNKVVIIIYFKELRKYKFRALFSFFYSIYFDYLIIINLLICK